MHVAADPQFGDMIQAIVAKDYFLIQILPSRTADFHERREELRREWLKTLRVEVEFADRFPLHFEVKLQPGVAGMQNQRRANHPPTPNPRNRLEVCRLSLFHPLPIDGRRVTPVDHPIHARNFPDPVAKRVAAFFHIRLMDGRESDKLSRPDGEQQPL